MIFIINNKVGNFMEIYWHSEKIKKLFENERALLDAGFDKKESKKVIMAMLHIDAVTSINQLPKNLNCHPIIAGKKFLHFTVDVPSIGGGRGKNRIHLVPVGDDYDLANLTTVTKVKILGIKKH